MSGFTLAALLAATVPVSGWAHHGFGRFEMNRDVEYSGTLVSMNLVNPHSHMMIEVQGPDGEINLSDHWAVEQAVLTIPPEGGNGALVPRSNPRLSCKPTSIIFDWTFDRPINRMIQRFDENGERVIDIDSGLYSFSRRIHVRMQGHPADLAPSYAGHSIGNWEGDTLVVD